MAEVLTNASLVLARKPHPSPAAVASALVDAFLAEETWAAEPLTKAGAHVLGGRRRWLKHVVNDVMASFARRPAGSPRLLAIVIQQSPAFRGAIAHAIERGTPIRIRHLVAAPSQASEVARALPRIDTLSDLATMLDLTVGELEWFADTKQWNRRARVGPLHHYRYEWRSRPGRIPRLLEIPEDRLRRVQRRLLDDVLSLIPASDAAHGFIPGRSAVTGAAHHVATDVVISLDLTTFFARVTAARIYATIRQAGYSESVAHAITGLCTNAVPPRVLAAMPVGGSLDERFALRRALTMNHLPQGSPSSPMLANLAIRRLDARLSGWAAATGATYTRYADDLAFSGAGPLAKRSEAFVRGVQLIVKDEGHSINEAKTRTRRQSVRQTVTGIVVNQRVNVSRSDFDQLKAILHNCIIHGPAAQNRDNLDDFRAHLLGRITWVESVNAQRGQKLRQKFLSIRWPSVPSEPA